MWDEGTDTYKKERGGESLQVLMACFLLIKYKNNWVSADCPMTQLENPGLHLFKPENIHLCISVWLGDTRSQKTTKQQKNTSLWPVILVHQASVRSPHSRGYSSAFWEDHCRSKCKGVQWGGSKERKIILGRARKGIRKQVASGTAEEVHVHGWGQDAGNRQCREEQGGGRGTVCRIWQQPECMVHRKRWRGMKL